MSPGVRQAATFVSGPLAPVLLVEDSPADARLEQEMLAAAGIHAVDVARTLAEARERLRHPVSCVLLDLGLPDACGLETLTGVLDVAPDAAVVVFTGLADDEAGARAVAAGAQDYLVKGRTDADLLARTVRYAVERRNASRALSEAEDRRRSVLASVPVVLIAFDADGRVTLAEGHDVASPGPVPVPLLGRSFFERFGHAPELIDGARRALAGHEVLVEATIGERVWEVRLRPLRDPSDAVIGGLAVAADVTEQRRAAVALAASEQRYRRIVETAEEGIWLIDADAVTTFANAKLAHLLGTTVDEMIGAPLADFVLDVADRPVIEARLHECRRGRSEKYEFAWRRRDGTPVWTLVSSGPFFDDDGRYAGALHMLTDITERRRAERALAVSEERFRTLVHNSTDVVALVDAGAQLLYANPAAEAMLGLTPGDSVRRDLLTFVHPADHAAVRLAFEVLLARPSLNVPVEARLRRVDGEWRTVEAVCANRLDDPAIGGIVVNARDVTERRRAEHLLAAQSGVLELIARGAPLRDSLDLLAAEIERRSPGCRCAIHLADPAERRLEHGAGPSLSEAFERATDAVEIVPEGPTFAVAAYRRGPMVTGDIAHDPDWGPWQRQAAAEGIRAAWSSPIVAHEGSSVLGTITLYWPDARVPLDGTWEEIAWAPRLAGLAIERDRAENRLAYQAVHDALTGLPNRVLFVDRLSQTLARNVRTGRTCSVLFLDLDHFKLVNDSFGHPVGDELLVEIADRLLRVLRPGDTVARFGGDEFVILCDGVQADRGAVRVAQRLIDEVCRPVQLSGGEVVLTASIGIAPGPAGADADALLREADAAMYRAKQTGRSRIEVFDEAMRVRAVNRLNTEHALRRAVAREELCLHYQPQIALDTGALVGLEALVRWHHPDLGLLGPGEFVPLAEDTGLIAPIGAWILSEACQEAATWADGAPLVLSVNLSARQLAQPDTAEIVARTLERSGLDPSRLCLEVTESVLVEENADLPAGLGRLRDLGVRIAIDDFGTGYASLSYLKRLPVDVLKIDMSFVQGLGRDPGDDAIVATVLDLAARLGLLAIAEGVETADEADRLADLGCPVGQGFHFSRPVPPDRLGDWVTR